MCFNTYILLKENMKTRTQTCIELPRIKRTKNSWPGKVIQYLMSHPSGNPSWELAIEAIASYWLVEALHAGVEKPQLVLASRNAIEKLSGKLATINKIIEVEIPVASSYSYIKNESNLYVELSRIKRTRDSWEGRVIEYLVKYPSRKPCTELVIEAITSYWLVEALVDFNAEHSEVIKASRMAIEKLEAKLVTIRQIAGIENPQMTTVTAPVASNLVEVIEPDPKTKPQLQSNDGDDGDDEEDWSDLLDEQTLLLANIFSS